MPAAQLTPLALARPSWASSAERRLQDLIHSGHPSPVDALVAEVADMLHASREQAFKEVEQHVDLQAILSPGAGMGTPFIRTVGQTPKASLTAPWASPASTPSSAPRMPTHHVPGNPQVAVRSRRRAYTEGYVQPNASPTSSPRVEVRQVGCHTPISVAVVAPGGGTGINGPVYSELGRNPNFKVEVVGRSRAPYDVYPPCWPHGAPAPNLETFAQEVLDTRVAEQVRCMVFGSRGGQVVLPHMWQAQAHGLVPPVPPAVVINGGCAMNLPTPVLWPDSAITFLLIGGQDNFRGNFGIEEYVAETRSHVPKANRTTAILYVNEMTHMPQQLLLRAILGPMLKSLSSWQASGQAPLEHFRNILASMRKDGWSGRLLFTSGPGNWEDIQFSPFDIDRLQASPLILPEEHHVLEPMEFTAKDEVKALWKAAVNAATGQGGASMAPGKGNRFCEVVKAATANTHAAEVQQMQKPPVLPSGAVGRGGEGYSGLQVPIARSGPGLTHGTPDPTPISRTLGLPGRPRSYSANSSPMSNSLSPTSQTHLQNVFFVPDPSPKRSPLQVR